MVNPFSAMVQPLEKFWFAQIWAILYMTNGKLHKFLQISKI